MSGSHLRWSPCAILLVIAASAVAMCLAPGAAPAAPPLIEDNANDVTQALYEGGAVDAPAPRACDDTCQRVRDLEQHPPGDAPPVFFARLKNGMSMLRRRVSLTPSLRSLDSPLAVFEAAHAGWKIGQALNRRFVDLWVPTYPYPASDTVGQPFAIALWGPHDQGDHLVGNPDIYAPYDGFVAYNQGGSYIVEWTEEPGGCEQLINYTIRAPYDDGYPHVSPQAAGPAAPDGTRVSYLDGVSPAPGYCWHDYNDNYSYDNGETTPYAIHYGVFYFEAAPDSSVPYTGSQAQLDSQGRTADGDFSYPGATDPGFTQAQHDAMDELNDGTRYDLVRPWLQFAIDPRCHPNPLSSTVTIPEVLQDETAEHYENCLQTLGLTVDVETLPGSVPDVANGGVGEISTDPGTSVDPTDNTENRVNIGKTPTPGSGPQPDPRCKPPGDDEDASDPGAPQDHGLTIASPAPETLAPYKSIDPRVPTHPQYQVPFRYGKHNAGGGWGWRHIKAQRGYGTQSEQDTMAALQDPAPILYYASTEQYRFHHHYDVNHDGQVLDCVRTVSVEYEANVDDGTGTKVVKGIQNSFYGIWHPYVYP